MTREGHNLANPSKRIFSISETLTLHMLCYIRAEIYLVTVGGGRRSCISACWLKILMMKLKFQTATVSIFS